MNNFVELPSFTRFIKSINDSDFTESVNKVLESKKLGNKPNGNLLRWGQELYNGLLDLGKVKYAKIISSWIDNLIASLPFDKNGKCTVKFY